HTEQLRLRGWCLRGVGLHARPDHIHLCAHRRTGVSCATAGSVLLRKRDVITLSSADVEEAAYAHQERPHPGPNPSVAASHRSHVGPSTPCTLDPAMYT